MPGTSLRLDRRRFLAVGAGLEEPWRSHCAPHLFVGGFAGGLFLAGGVGDPESVEVNGFGVDVVGVGITFDDEAEECS